VSRARTGITPGVTEPPGSSDSSTGSRNDQSYEQEYGPDTAYTLLLGRCRGRGRRGSWLLRLLWIVLVLLLLGLRRVRLLIGWLLVRWLLLTIGGRILSLRRITSRLGSLCHRVVIRLPP
jgi:hypothetical protein